MLLALLAIGVMAATTARAASLIGTTTAQAGAYSASHYYSHFANGHYWVAFNTGAQLVPSSSPDGVTWASQGTIFGSSVADDTNRWAVRYRASLVIALAFNSGDSTRYYRLGTLNANGSVSGAAPRRQAPLTRPIPT